MTVGVIHALERLCLLPLHCICVQVARRAAAFICQLLSSAVTECRWAKTYGITTSLLVRSFANGLRGVAPAVALASGDVALCIPESLLINSDTALASDLGRAIASVPGVDDDTVKLLWTMAERHDRESPRAPFWQSLPATMVTGVRLRALA